MNLKDAARNFWRNLSAFAYAMEFDHRDDMMSRVERLECDGRSLQTDMRALSQQVLDMFEQVKREAGRLGQ